MSGDLRIGVDIGGTFTDVVVRRPGSPSRIMKIPTTRSDPSIAVLEALEAHAGRVGPGAAGRRALRARHHGRDQRRAGAQGRQGRRDHHRGIPRRARDRAADAPPDVRAGARARDADLPGAGTHAARSAGAGQPRPARCSKPLDEAAVADAADALVAAGARRSRSCSCSRSSTTRTSGARERSSCRRHPDMFVSLSSEVDPAFREYERTVVTAFDAYVKPVVDRYLANLDSGLLSASVLRAAAGHAVARRHVRIAYRAAAPGAPVSLRARGRRDRRQDGRPRPPACAT